MADDNIDVDPKASRDERADCIAWTIDALGGLDAVQRAALTMVYFDGLTQSQAASRLGLPAAVVREAIARGLRHLAARIECRGGPAGSHPELRA